MMWNTTFAGTIEKGYVRDFRTGLIYCDTQCFAGGAYNFTKNRVINKSSPWEAKSQN
jgi:hypothetical protein